ncbi:transposase [Hirsutella rhossiliensis]|uniref:Transposase n=1 Tax=Hirsutella rhossiliensis TaxID=111463 RepID=A0A9P8MZE3_9HYPO|nr:transposase [Hirsutella rhossiliensis]KAH0964112.1 transposase [Hirsutella rhossiliensis]
MDPLLPLRDATAPQSDSKEAHDHEEPPQTAIPPLPPSPGFKTYNEAYNFIQGFLRDNGAAVIRRSSSRKRDIDGTSLATRIIFICDRGPQRASTSTGLRKTSTQKLDCPFRLLVTASCNEGIWKWDFRATEDHHNHGPSLDPSAHNIHRRRTSIQQALERNLSKHKALPAREISSILRDADPSAAFFRIRDVYNDRQKLRFEALGGETATQAFEGTSRKMRSGPRSLAASQQRSSGKGNTRGRVSKGGRARGGAPTASSRRLPSSGVEAPTQSQGPEEPDQLTGRDVATSG